MSIRIFEIDRLGKICQSLLVCYFFGIGINGFSQIQSQETIRVGGINQWIDIRGANINDPILLFLHGGPGNSVISYADKFTDELQKHFVVVFWDQRESGKTASLNPTNKPLAVSLMVSDAEEVIQILMKRFSRKKIYLMGHSWGGFLALMVAHKNPELLEACFAISPMINQLESEKISLTWMRQEAETKNQPNASRELAGIKIPFENPEQLYFDRKWIAIYSNKKPPVKSFVIDWGKKWLGLYNEACAVNLSVVAPEMKCPVYFFIGDQDRQTHFEIANGYFKSLKAEKKELFWFANAGHSLNLSDPEKMQRLVISKIIN